MDTINQMVQVIQAGHLEEFNLLLTQFEPLIMSWLKKNKKLYDSEREDYYSMAKIILLECALNFDFTKHVPFPSYYKITLWHTTGNFIRKKKPLCVSLDTYGDERDPKDFTEDYERKEQLQKLKSFSKVLTAREQDILEKVQEGYEIGEIAAMLGIKKKTVQNQKYIAIKKLKAAIQEER